MKTRTILSMAAFVLISSILSLSCQKKKTNDKLFEESKSPDLSFYKEKDTIYGAKGGSPHGSFKLKFNAAARAALDNEGKLPVGEEFPDGSLVVKEVFNGNEKTLYAVMKKDSKSKYATNKWVWAEYEPDGKVVYNVTRKGSTCTGCHSSGAARDFTRSFDLH